MSERGGESAGSWWSLADLAAAPLLRQPAEQEGLRNPI